jgi:maltose alpha-D-glucosyltransferase/alpha-amylase
MLTLAGHGFYWFELSRPAEPVEEFDEQTASRSVADSLLAAGVVGDGDATTDPSGGTR